MLLAPSDRKLVRDAMTPDDKVIRVAPGISQEQAKALLYEYRLEKLPIVDTEGKIAGLVTARDVAKGQEYPDATP